MKKLLLLATLLFTPAVAFADKEPVDLIVGCWSSHRDLGGAVEEQQDFNGNNKCLGLQYKNYMVMTYQNSYYDRSYVVARDFNYKLDAGFSAGIRAGIVTGYEKNPVMPMVLPYISKSFNNRVHIDGYWIPTQLVAVNLRVTVGWFE